MTPISASLDVSHPACCRHVEYGCGEWVGKWSCVCVCEGGADLRRACAARSRELAGDWCTNRSGSAFEGVSFQRINKYHVQDQRFIVSGFRVFGEAVG